MVTETPAIPAASSALTDPAPVRRRPRRPWTLLAVAGAVLVLAGWASGFRPGLAWSRSGPKLALVTVDRGDVPVFITEYGSLESADDEPIRCQVEALIGTVGGMSATGSGTRGATSGTGTTTATTTTATTSAATKSGATSSSSSTSASGTQTTTSSTTAGDTTTGGTTTTDQTAQNGSSTTPKPTIVSFSYVVEPHVPLRPQTSQASQATKAAKSATSPGGGMGGGQGSGDAAEAEKAGSTRILSILPEGTQVQAGEIVCELDSSAFRDELLAQRIRYTQAKSWLDQAVALLEVSKIALVEYQEGIYHEDLEHITLYIKACQNDYKRALETRDWSRATFQKGLRSRSQLKSDELNLERAEITLREAEGMKTRLVEYTGPRLILDLEAKVAAVEADLHAQEAAFQLESTRLRRLEETVANCTLRAPREGVVVYDNQTNAWGRVTSQIEAGATVRQGQSIFRLPDPRRMAVRARINQSRVALIHPGQAAEIRVDAYPDHLLTGTVADVTQIPAPALGPISDVKVYFAMVRIDSGVFDGLRPGLSAEVSFLGEVRRDVVRVPVQAVRWVDGRPYAARASSSGIEWRRLELGAGGPASIEVLSGLQPGDRVAVDPGALPAPDDTGS